MAKVRAIVRDAERIDEPPRLHGRAMDNLRFIRETMECSTHFTAVPGYGGVFIGLTALCAAYITARQAFIQDWLIVWLSEAVLAFAVGLFAMRRKSKIANVSLSSARAKKFAMSFLPPLICAIVITLGLWRLGQFEALIPVWILLYGAAVVTRGSFSARVIPVMGWCFIALGAAAFFLPVSFGNLMMALSFGVLHIIFGVVIARRFGG
ncbi:MAG TPA: hypothetical protein VNI84_02665 [Pyrinomonadaceae bacterium]|nr:hypothetical protein [Pyrinomonadaceae bacterium]